MVPVSLKLSLTFGLIDPRIFVRNEIAKKIRINKEDKIVVTFHNCWWINSRFKVTLNYKNSNICNMQVLK